MPDAERFWSKVQRRDADDCWPWIAYLAKNGYGDFRVRIGGEAKTVQSHRMAFFLTYGFWPKECRHTCVGHRWCCNPRHLLDGTKHDNIMDSVEQGRHGSMRRRKLSPDEIRTCRASADSVEALARRYGVDYHTMWDVMNHRTYREIA